jgi:cobalamin biosynthesis Mg chelatase CobN
MVKLTSHKRSVCLVALAILLLGVVPVASGVWLTGSFAHGQPDQATTTSTTTTPVGSIVFTSPSSGSSFAGPQSYTISATISPTPPSRDNVSILVTLLGSSSAIDSSTQAVTASGTFSYATHVGGTPSWVTGTYVISATDSHGATGLTTFEYTAPAVTTTTTTSKTTASSSTSTTSSSTTTSTSTTSTTTKTTSTSVSTTTASSQPPATTTVTQTVTPAPLTITSTTITTPAPSTLTKTSIQTVTSTVTQTSSVIPDWAYGAMVVLLLAGVAVGYVVKGSSARKG